MIYQLRVTLNDVNPPASRVVEVDSKMTFADFHRLLQVIFDWEDIHLHKFIIQKWKGKTIKEKVTIEPIDDEMDLFWRMDMESGYDESEETLENWLSEVNDRCLYIYDFGDSWEHEIVLAGIVGPEDQVLYPRCIAAHGISPEEDSRGIFDETEEYAGEKKEEPVNLVEDINKRLRFAVEGNIISIQEWNCLFSLANELKMLKPWTWLDDNQIFAVNHPDGQELIYCSIMGAGLQEFGLAAYIGKKGLQGLHKTMLGFPLDELVMEQENLLVSFVNRDELEKEDYELIKSTGLKCRGKKQWIQFRSFRSGFFPWFLDRTEVKLLIDILPSIIDVCKAAKTKPDLIPQFNGDSVVLVNENGKREKIDTPFSEVEEMAQTESFVLDELTVKKMQVKAKRFSTPIECDYFYLDEPVQDSRDSRPFFPVMLLCAEIENEMIVHQDMLKPSEISSIPYCIPAIFNELGAIPSELIVHRKNLYRILEPIAKQLNINLVLVEELFIIPEVKKDLLSMIGKY